jgi:rhodanese-related sulfurtransferase
MNRLENEGMVTMKKTNYISMFLIVVMFILSTGCQSTVAPTSISATPVIGKVEIVDGGSYTSISVIDLQSLMKKKDFILINVHTPFQGNMPKTDLSIPYDTIGQNLDKIPGNNNSKILLYCRSGRMSTIAAKELVKLGYANIWNLDGGMAAWEQAGQPIER